jgi:hypothetical protein
MTETVQGYRGEMRNERRKKDRGTWVGRRAKRGGVYDIMPHLLL